MQKQHNCLSLLMCYFSEKMKVFLRRIKYPEEKKCANDITPLMVLLKNQGAYTESNQYKPRICKSIALTAQFYLTVKAQLTVQVDKVEYHRSITCLYRRCPI
jgi:hypothetical protein